MAVIEARPRSLPGSRWRIEFDDAREDALSNAARLAITDGCVGSQTFTEIGTATGRGESVAVAGTYGPEPPAALLTAPAWTPENWLGEGLGWALDLRTGIVSHRLRINGGELETRRWSIAGHPGSQAFVASIPTSYEIPRPTTPATAVLLGGADGTRAALVWVDQLVDTSYTRVVAAGIGATDSTASARAQDLAERLVQGGGAKLEADQHAAWAQRWSECNVSIEGDPDAEVRTRFALYQLMALDDCGDELPLGPRGLTGPAYLGHVFWDTDVFVLPAVASVAPNAARAMVEYRLRRLHAARQAARSEGLNGARFPWESASTGRDVTPLNAIKPNGEVVAIRTGEQELHISADVYWGIGQYVRWTGDTDVIRAGAGDLGVETARYWSSRIATDIRAPGHISRVIGPDEYHEGINDNAFTNRMAAWNLREASRLVSSGMAGSVDRGECLEWQRTAAGLHDGYDRDSGRHWQFDGYDQLETIMAEAIAPPPFAADILLGHEVVGRSQLIKQADVLMMHHMIPDCLPIGSLANDLAYYLPRTCHGSSLSPAVHATVLARAGRADEALRWYRIALAIDLDDLTGTGSGGLHYATFGGVWQALVGGFLGLRPGNNGLEVDPHLPSDWQSVHLAFRFGGAKIEIHADHSEVTVCASEAITFALRCGASTRHTSRLRLRRTDDGWGDT